MIIPTVFTACLTSVWSATTKAKVEGDYQWIANTIRKMLLLVMLFSVGIVLIAVFFRSIAFLWINIHLEYTDTLIMLGAVYGILMMWCNVFSYVANGMGMISIALLFAVLQAVVNIPLSLFFSKTLSMGMAGVLLGTEVAMTIAGIGLPIVIRREITVNGD